MESARRPFPEIAEGELVDPWLLHAVVDHVVPGPAPPVVELSAEQVLARARRRTLPRWAAGLPLSARSRLEGAMARAGFDLRRRLDERTLVAPNPEGGDRPLLVLELGRPGVDLTRIDLFELELAAGELVVLDPGAHQAVDRDSLLRAVAVRLKDLPAAPTRHRPGLALREHLRLALVYEGLELGGPIGMLTLLPGERRSVRTVRRTRSRIEETGELGIESRDARETTRSLQREFRRSWERQRTAERLRGLVWSRSAQASSSTSSASVVRESTEDREDAWSLETSAVREALDRAALSLGREIEEVRILETVRERLDEEERTDTVELENPLADRAVTHVAHHVLVAYRAHLDVVDAELLWHPEDPTGSVRRLDLRGDWRDGLQRLPAPPPEKAAAGVAELLRARYGPLEALSEEGTTLLPMAADAVNLDLVDRGTMLVPDRRDRRGPLPVCLLSRRVGVRSGGTFVRTYADDPGLGVPAPAAADP